MITGHQDIKPDRSIFLSKNVSTSRHPSGLDLTGFHHCLVAPSNELSSTEPSATPVSLWYISTTCRSVSRNQVRNRSCHETRLTFWPPPANRTRRSTRFWASGKVLCLQDETWAGHHSVYRYESQLVAPEFAELEDLIYSPEIRSLPKTIS